MNQFQLVDGGGERSRHGGSSSLQVLSLKFSGLQRVYLSGMLYGTYAGLEIEERRIE